MEKTDDFIKKIAGSFPNIAGVKPTQNTPAAIRREFINRQLSPDTDAGKVLTAINQIKSAIAQVGLDITVNSVSRVVRDLLTQMKSDRTDRLTIRPFPSMYKGVSFNPQTFDKKRGPGEWIVLLDFYAFIRQIIDLKLAANEPVPFFAILDAGLYWLVNLKGRSFRIEGKTAEEAAANCITILGSMLQEKLFQEVLECNRIRNAYLRAIASQFPQVTQPVVFTLKDVWFDPEYIPFLAKAIELFCIKTGTAWKVNNAVAYNRYMPYSPWITPLAMSETVFIGEKLKVYGILSPTAEAVWNKVNDQLSRYMNTPPFIAWMYTRKLGRVLSYQSVPYLSDSEETIFSKLQQAQRVDNTITELLCRLASPFAPPYLKPKLISSSFTTSSAAGLLAEILAPIETAAKKILSTESDIPPTPIDQVGWLMQFPPGIC